MMKMLKEICLAVLLGFPCWGQNAHAIDVWEQLKNAFQSRSAKKIEKA